MKNNRNYGLYAIAVAIAVVGALALGVPLGTLAFLLIALACPLMMFFMMRGMHGGDDMKGRGHDHDDPPKDREPHDHRPFR
ncbi:DUF2933 domain-containing protein [Streptomyces sp. NBC_01481]|uniref:DUF2933 domain-containing protein n=1 Tax=Streptomyces sp. NBC_01481 TaxID=2975869 RepID=UPI00225A6D9A|nr:DUF2933 domain-containing protein [Streptomyces sp. NBC_01481]MCX4585941.1 DUF2933 domain-containing protein [Streptomyces sp. NBC_01481]